MEKLSLLAKHIESLPGITRDQMEAFADLGKLIPTGKDLGHGLEIGRFKYDAVISIERCPAVIASLLLSSLLIWLDTNDPNRDRYNLADPDIDITIEDEQTVFVQITIEFAEGLAIVEDPNGPLLYSGTRWKVASVGIDVAESLDSLEKG
ncbi:MAG: phage tail protein [Desulforhopalus sp.]